MCHSMKRHMTDPVQVMLRQGQLGRMLVRTPSGSFFSRVAICAQYLYHQIAGPIIAFKPKSQRFITSRFAVLGTVAIFVVQYQEWFSIFPAAFTRWTISLYGLGSSFVVLVFCFLIILSSTLGPRFCLNLAGTFWIFLSPSTASIRLEFVLFRFSAKLLGFKHYRPGFTFTSVMLLAQTFAIKFVIASIYRACLHRQRGI